MRSFSTWCSRAAVFALFASIANAQYSATFETPTFIVGPLEGQEIWTNWTGTNATITQVVSTQNHTPGGSQSVEVTTGTDTVADFDALPGGSFNAGQWTVRAMSLCPSGGTGSTYFLVMNEWDASGTPPYEWNLQLQLASGLGRARLYTPDGIKEVALVYNTWTEIRAEYDLGANTVSVYYDNALIWTYDPRCGVTTGCATPYSGSFIDAIDLYPDPATNPSNIFFDDISVELPGGGGPVGTAACFGDGVANGGAACPCGNDAVQGSGGGCENGPPMPAGQGAVLSGFGTSSIAADNLVLTANFVTNQPGLFFQGDVTIAGGNGVNFGDGLRCCGTNVVRLEIADPTGANGVHTTSTTQQIIATSPPGTIAPGVKQCYQFWYRNPGRSLCGANFNLSNAVSVTWTP